MLAKKLKMLKSREKQQKKKIDERGERNEMIFNMFVLCSLKKHLWCRLSEKNERRKEEKNYNIKKHGTLEEQENE